MDNSDWKHPSERNEERYYVTEVDELDDPKTGMTTVQAGGVGGMLAV